MGRVEVLIGFILVKKTLRKCVEKLFKDLQVVFRMPEETVNTLNCKALYKCCYHHQRVSQKPTRVKVIDTIRTDPKKDYKPI